MTMAEVLDGIRGLAERFDRHAKRLQALERETGMEPDPDDDDEEEKAKKAADAKDAKDDDHALSPWQHQRPVNRRASQGRNKRRFPGPTANTERGIGYPRLESSLKKAPLPGQQVERLAS
jgi:branched-subunit amino acid aminotransferase/4-amino-4-deoxychorismate lyase